MDLFAPAKVTRTIPLELPAADSVIGELTSWRYGQSIGLHAYRVQLVDDGPLPKEVDVVVKVKATDGGVREVGQEVATLCSPALGAAYHRFSDRLGFSHSDVRELSVYRESDERLRRYTPKFYGGWTERGQTVLVLEKLSGMTLMNSTDQPEAWQREHIEAAIEGLGEIHSLSYGRTGQLPDSWNVAPHSTLSSMLEARPLWSALASHAAPMFSKWIGSQFCAFHRDLIESLDRWWTDVEGMPHTLIHNDCNPRNLAFRQTDGSLRLCLYDWELATAGLPQHDLAELLCFVLGPQLHPPDVFSYIDKHRRVLERYSGRTIGAKTWRQGFRLSLNDLMINRLPAYAMIHRFQKQRFLERVIRTWMALTECV